MNTLAAPEQELVREAARSLLDPQGRALAAQVEWWQLPGLGPIDWGSWPVAVLREGPPVLLLHGFDSSFLEFRRLVPLLRHSRSRPVQQRGQPGRRRRDSSQRDADF